MTYRHNIDDVGSTKIEFDFKNKPKINRSILIRIEKLVQSRVRNTMPLHPNSI